MKTHNFFKNLLKMIVIPLVLHFTNARAQVLPDYSAFPQSSIGFNTSTQGFGAQGSYSFLHFFNVRVGLDFSPGLSIQYNGRSAQLERASFYTMIDWQPMYGESSWLARKWFISTGAAYYFTNTLNREAGGTVGSYSIYMSKFRPYIGTGLGNIPITNTLGLRLDMGYFIPTSAPTATYDDRGTKVSTGLRGLLPGLNTGVTFCIKF